MAEDLEVRRLETARRHPEHRIEKQQSDAERSQVHDVDEASSALQGDRLPLVQRREHEPVGQGLVDLAVEPPAVGVNDRHQRGQSGHQREMSDLRPGEDRFAQVIRERGPVADEEAYSGRNSKDHGQSEEADRKATVQISPKQKQRRKPPEMS